MATVEIPINPAYSAQLMTIQLDGVRYRLRVYYSFREEVWYLDILSDRETDIIIGIKLVPDWPLIERFQIPGQPPGELYAIDTSGKGLPPGRTELGTGRRVRLRYVEATA